MCCDQSPPTLEELTEEDEDEVTDEKLSAVIDEFPIDFQLASNCGQRSGFFVIFYSLVKKD